MNMESLFLAHIVSQYFRKWLGISYQTPVLQKLSVKDLDVKKMSRELRSWLTHPQINFIGLEKLLPKIQLHFDQIIELAKAEFELISKRSDSNLLLLPDKLYPYNLRYTMDPPIALGVLGNCELFDRPMVAIVGSRKSSPRALNETFSLAKDLASHGYVIVSGGAYGCDRMAHEGALEGADSSTIVVLAGGFGNPYPKGNLGLFRRVLAQGGAIVSERLWQATCRPYDFPIRNRLISGIVDQVVIGDAFNQSGALNTANLAATQGREVLVLDLGESSSLGTFKLIQEGALSAKDWRSLSCMLRSDYRERVYEEG